MTNYLSGVPIAYVEDRLRKAGGKEIESGKFASPESSAALAVNCFAWFHERPHLLPPFPGVGAAYPATAVDVEFEARFPWPGGRHPWLDAFIETPSHIIGVESKRFEPFRNKKTANLSSAYDRPVWGENMQAFEQMRDLLRTGETSYKNLDAVQLVKHAFGLVTESLRARKPAILVYLYAEPETLNGRPIPVTDIAHHRAEALDFSERVLRSAVEFHALPYKNWLASWASQAPEVQAHGSELADAFSP